VLDTNSLPTAPSSTLALPYYNWPDGVLGAEWQFRVMVRIRVRVIRAR
jgi:hypothetical protein